MDERQITALAKGMVPFVREVVTAAVTPLAARLAEIEARPIQKGDAGEPGAAGPPGPKGDGGELGLVPPDLALKVASVVRLLHESPPIVQRAAAPAPLSRIVRIERDDQGNFLPVYGELQP